MIVGSTAWECLLYAYRRGCRVTKHGVVENAQGKPLKVYDNSRDGYFSFYQKHPVTKKWAPVWLHQLVALQKYGEERLGDPKIHVRHKDGNPKNNSFDNILLGTPSQNSLDKPKEVRRRIAEHASSFIQRKDWSQIEADRAAGMTYDQLAEKYSMSKGTLSYHFSKTGKRRRKTPAPPS